ncbi:MAG: Ger(x)C family spore germination protein [Bacillota bacterium]
MGSRRGLWGLLLLCLALLPGCWDRTEVEDMVYLIAIGLDPAEEGGLMVSAMVAVTPELTAGGFEPPVKPERTRLAHRLLTARGKTITEALFVVNGGLTRQLDLRQLRAVVVGEELSRAGLEPYLMELTRSPWARGNALLAQARGRAYDVLRELQPVSEVDPPKMIEGLILQAKRLHMAPPLRMHHFVARHAAAGGDPYLPAMAINPDVTANPQEPPELPPESALPGELPRGSGNPVEYAGTAIFRGDQLAGYLTVDQTQMLLALRGEMGKAYTTFPDPDHPNRSVSMRFHMENLPKYQATFRNGHPHIVVRMLFEGEVLAAPGGTDYVKPQARTRLEEAAARHAEETTAALLERLKGWEADPVGFGHLYRGQFISWQDWEAFDWHRRIRDLTVEVEAKMRIRRHGLVVGPDRVKGGR